MWPTQFAWPHWKQISVRHIFNVLQIFLLPDSGVFVFGPSHKLWNLLHWGWGCMICQKETPCYIGIFIYFHSNCDIAPNCAELTKWEQLFTCSHIFLWFSHFKDVSVWCIILKSKFESLTEKLLVAKPYVSSRLQFLHNFELKEAGV